MEHTLFVPAGRAEVMEKNSPDVRNDQLAELTMRLSTEEAVQRFIATITVGID